MANLNKKRTKMATPVEPTIHSTDQVILSRITRMAGIPEELRQRIMLFKQSFINSSNSIVRQRQSLAASIAKYKEKSRSCTIHKTQIQHLQVDLERVLQEIEDLKFNSSDVLHLRDQIEEQQKIVDQMNHLLEETISQKEKAETNRKMKIQEIEQIKQQKVIVNGTLNAQWDKHSELTKKLGDNETQAQQLRNSNEERQRAISTMEANAEEWRRNMNKKETQIDEEINKLQKEITSIETQINDVSSEKNEAISSYQHQISTLNAEIDSHNEKTKDQVREIGSMKANIEHIVEESQRLKEESQQAGEELAERKKELATLMGELATRMSLPETQTKEIATLELDNRQLKKRVEELKSMWQASTNEVEDLADKISRAKIAKYDPAAQEAAIRERILRDSAIRVQEIVDSAMKMLTCPECGKVLEVPVTLVPCGHCVCYSHKYQQNAVTRLCPKCGECVVCAYVDNSLAVVLSKFVYIKDVLSMLSK